MGESLTGEAAGDVEGAGGLAEGHFAEFLIADGFEKALSGGAEFLSGFPFLLAALDGAAGPIGGVFVVEIELDLGLMLEEAGIERGDALGPLMTNGPLLDRREMLVELVGDGLERAGAAEGEVGREGGEGARSFAGGSGEGG